MDSLEPLVIVECGPGLFHVRGEVDLATAPLLEELEDVHGPLVLDLHGVSFMDSTGIAALVRLHRRCGDDDCTFRIEACSPNVERVLRLVCLYEIFTSDGQPVGSPSPGSTVEPGTAAAD